MPITREAEEGWLSVTVDIEKKKVALLSKYSDPHLEVEGNITISDELVDVGLNWGYPLDYITTQIINRIVYEDIDIVGLTEASMDDIMNEVYTRTFMEEGEIQYYLQFCFNKKYLARGEQMADFLIKFLTSFVHDITKIIEFVREKE